MATWKRVLIEEDLKYDVQDSIPDDTNTAPDLSQLNNYTKADLEQKTISEVLDILLFPTVDAKTHTSHSLNDGLTNTLNETGSTLTLSPNVIFTVGSYKNGDGGIHSYTNSVSNINATYGSNELYNSSTIPNGSISYASITVLQGNNNVTTTATLNPDTTSVYKDNKGGTSTAVPGIDAQKAMTSISANAQITGYLPIFYGYVSKNDLTLAANGTYASSANADIVQGKIENTSNHINSNPSQKDKFKKIIDNHTSDLTVTTSNMTSDDVLVLAIPSGNNHANWVENGNALNSGSIGNSTGNGAINRVSTVADFNTGLMSNQSYDIFIAAASEWNTITIS